MRRLRWEIRGKAETFFSLKAGRGRRGWRTTEEEGLISDERLGFGVDPINEIEASIFVRTERTNPRSWD